MTRSARRARHTLGRMIRPALLVLALSACGDDGGSQTQIDAPKSIDAAAIDAPAIDAAPSLLPLIGTWHRAPAAAPHTGFATITFTADGKTLTTNTGTTETGTYTVPMMGRVHLDPD